MRRSIFLKYFWFCASIIIVGVVILGTITLIFSANYFKNEKKTILTTNARRFAKITNNAIINNQIDSYNIQSLISTYEILSKTIDANITLINADGVTIVCTEPYPCNHTTFKLPATALQKLSKGEYFEFGDFFDTFKETQYVAVVPIIKYNQTIGYICCATPAASQKGYFFAIFRTIVISSIIVLVLAAIVIYFISGKLAEPLRQISDVAKRFGKGDFSKKLAIKGQDEVSQLALALNKMAKELSYSELMRRSFVANVSHELRTPMTTISGFIDGILDGTIKPEEQKKYLSIVSTETKRLSRLVQSMLNLSRIEAGEFSLNITSFNIVDTICRTLFNFENTIEEKNVKIIGLDIDKITVDADEDLIHQVVYNLIENAVKFVNINGFISFEFHQSEDKIFVRIKNSGDGISSDELYKIFHKFYKTDVSRGLDKKGIGLGLYLAKMCLRLHNGDIRASSVVGQYTQFEFFLPRLNSTQQDNQ